MRVGELEMAMRNLLLALAALLLPVAATPATAMTFKVENTGNNLILHFDGKIQTGDGHRMQKFMQQLDRKSLNAIIIRLNISGGKIPDATIMSRLIHKSGHPVLVGNQCTSACFLLFAASPSKQTEAHAVLGVHRAVYEDTGQEAPDGTMAMASLYAEYGVPHYIIEKMLTTAPNDMYFLTDADLRTLHVQVVNPSSIPWGILIVASGILLVWMRWQRFKLAEAVRGGRKCPQPAQSNRH